MQVKLAVAQRLARLPLHAVRVPIMDLVGVVLRPKDRGAFVVEPHVL